MLLGYARVSTDDQNLDLQKDALKKAGCQKIFEDTESGAKTVRKGLEEAIAFARPGDAIVVWRLDRLSRSLKDLIDLVTRLEAIGVGLNSISENLDTTSDSGKLILHVFGALAEFERSLIRERTNAGLKAARARGRVGGRPEKLTPIQKQALISMRLTNKFTDAELCEMMEITKPTLYKIIRADQAARDASEGKTNDAK